MAACAGVAVSSDRIWFAALAWPPGLLPGSAIFTSGASLAVVVGVAAWRVYLRLDGAVIRTYRALRCWGWQLLLSAVWVMCLFALESPLLAAATTVFLLATVVVTIVRFRRVDRVASIMLLPYLAGCAYAAYLVAGLWWLNGV